MRRPIPHLGAWFAVAAAISAIACALPAAAAEVELTYDPGSAITQAQANRYTDLAPDICENVQPPNSHAPPLSITSSCQAQRAGETGGSGTISTTGTVTVMPSVVGTAPSGKPLITGLTVTVTANVSASATSSGGEQENKLQAFGGATAGATFFFKGPAGTPVNVSLQVNGPPPQGQNGCFSNLQSGQTMLMGSGGVLSASLGCIANAFADVNGTQTFDYTATLTLSFGNVPSGDIEWVEPAGGDFADADNWDPPQVPEVSATRADTAVFNLANTYPVNVSGAKAKRIVIRNSSIDLVGGSAQATSSAPSEPSLVIGQSGKLHLVSGTLTTVDSVLGDVSGGGLAEVDLISSAPTWTNGGRLTIGDAGPGRLTVVSGQVTSAESRIGGGMLGAGDAIVGGPGAWTTGNLGLGLGGGAGTLEVKDGGLVTSDGAVIGVAFGTGNLATVTGSVPGNDALPSTWDVDTNLDVGKAGAGQLDVLDGARVHCDSLRIATASQGVAGVRVKGSAADKEPPSRLESDFLLEVGKTGVGSLTVQDGGLVSTFSLGVGVNGPGTVMLEGERIVPIPGDPAPVPSLLIATLDATVGVSASGTVQIRDGAQLGTPLLVVGVQASGVVDVDGAGLLATTSLIKIGSGAAGTMNVTAGGTVFAHEIDLGAAASSVGRIVLTGESGPTVGAESSVLAGADVRVGVLGAGEVTVRDGALLFIQSPGRLEITAAGGAATADRGHVIVTGRGTNRSMIDARSDVRIGGRGKLEVQDGGLVTIAGAALLGGGGAGVFEVEGVRAGSNVPSTATVTGNVVVGTNGDGGASVLSVTAGGRMSIGGTLFVGGLGSDDFAIIDGASGAVASKLDVTGPIRVSEDSLLSITAGAQVTCASAIIGDEGPGTAAVGSPPGTPAWAVAGTLDVGITGTGLLALCPGGLVTAGDTVHIGPNGTLQGTQTIVAPQVVNDGTVAPGCSPGTLTIDGAYVQNAGGRLRVEIGGSAPGAHDVLQVTGAATLAGTLEIVFVDGFVPRTGDALDVLQVTGAVAGDFADVEVRGLPPGWKAEPTRTGNVFGFRVFGDYLCYRTAPAKGAKFPKALPGGLDTALGRLDFAIKGPFVLCNPSGPSTGSPEARDTQLRGYAVTGATADPLAIAARTLRVTNGLHPNGELLVDTAATTLVLANAAKCVDAPTGTCPSPLAPPADEDAYYCAPAKRSKAGAAFPKGLVGSAVDAFGEPRTYKLTKPTRVCAPASGALDHALACYAAKLVGKACALAAPTNAAGICKSEPDCGGTKKVTRLCAKQAKHAKIGGLVLATVLAGDRAGTVKPVELCVPSVLTAP